MNIIVETGGADGANGGTIAFGDLPAADPWNVDPFDLAGIGNVILQAANDVDINDSLTVSGSLVVQAGTTITVAPGSDVTANGVIHLEADTPHNGGPTGSGIVVVRAILDSSGNNITIIGDNFTIDMGGTITAGAGDVTFAHSSGGTLGSAQLSTAELNTIASTGTLTIGQGTSAGAGGDFVGGTLLRSSDLDFSTAVTIDANDAAAVVLIAADGVTFDNDLTVNQTLSIDADADAAGAGTFAVNGSDTITTNGLDLTVTAVDVSLNPGAGDRIDTGAGSVTVTTSQAVAIGLGDTGSGLDISNAELEKIVATNLDLVTTSANIVVDNIDTTGSGGISGTITLNATGDTTFSTNSSDFQSALDAQATGQVLVNQNVSAVGLLTMNGGTDIQLADDTTLTGAGVILARPSTLRARTRHSTPSLRPTPPPSTTPVSPPPTTRLSRLLLTEASRSATASTLGPVLLTLLLIASMTAAKA